MSGQASRDKGARFEREVAQVFRENGWFHAKRTSDGRAQAERGDITDGPDGYYFELKRQEKLNVPAALDQIDRDAPPLQVPVLIHRPSRHEAMATLLLDDLLVLIKRAEL